MPQFDLRGIKVAKYVNNNHAISYTGAQSAGDAMTVNLELRNAEGRLYAESSLAEYMRKATGGTISLGVKYIPNAVQQLLFGMTEKTRTVTYEEGGDSVSKQVPSLQLGAKSQGAYVGVAFYAPDMVDGAEKYTAVFLAKTLFGPPSMTLQTAGENIVFNTPVTNGEFLPDDSADKVLQDIAICDSEAEAQAWVDTVLSAS